MYLKSVTREPNIGSSDTRVYQQTKESDNYDTHAGNNLKQVKYQFHDMAQLTFRQIQDIWLSMWTFGHY